MKEQKKRYLIYQIRNLINNKIYIGKHITTNIEDNYFGSGTLIQKAIQKYGLENFEFKILFELQNEEEMNLLEECVVTNDFCKRKDTYNINVGGNGGWNYVNTKIVNETEEDCKQRRLAISVAIKKRINNMTPEEREEFRKQNSEHAKKTGFSQSFKGRKHSSETRKKISDAYQKNPQVGDKNGMHGKHWIRNPQTHEYKIISENEQLPNGWEYGKYQTMTEKAKQQIKIFSKSCKGKQKIFNPTTGEIRYINKNDKLPEGFERCGRPLTDKEKQYLKKHFKEYNEKYIKPKRIEELRPMYQYYLEFGWKSCKEHFNYQYSQQNFVGLCKRYLPEFKSNQKK